MNNNIIEIAERDQALKETIETPTKEGVAVVFGWQNRLFNITEADIDVEKPVIVWSLGLHNFVFNRAAKDYLKDENELIVNNINDQIWVEKNLSDIFLLLLKLSSLHENSVSTFFKGILSTGIWAVEDMLTTKSLMNFLDTSEFKERTKLWTTLNVFSELNEAEQQKIKGIKAFADGAASIRTAAFNKEYLEGGRGLLIYENKELKNLLYEVNAINKSIAIHAIGDRALDQVVNIIVDIKKDISNIPEIRIEHASYISKETAVNAKKAGIVLVMQPNFSIESETFKHIVPDGYTEFNNPFRMLIDDVGYRPGKDLFLSSDGMPHGINEALNQSLFPVLESQKLSLDEFVDGYCVKDTSMGKIEIEVDERNKHCSANVIIK